jgi:hypothetical protein
MIMDQAGQYARNPSLSGLAGAGQNIIRAAIPSLEQRLDHLQRGVERLSKARHMLEVIADLISLDASPPPAGCASPQSSDLSSRFGETISYVHENVDSIDRLLTRIENALFDSTPKPVRG